ncbi:MAG TPA: hypothetical protein VLS45_00705 [Methylomicrobium sp.]|nr:hypothetical protein [Methylomicrobium sp.]
MKSLPANIRAATSTVLKDEAARQADLAESEGASSSDRGRCFQCMTGMTGTGYKAKRRNMNSHVQTRCSDCNRRVCSKHSVKLIRCNMCDAGAGETLESDCSD